MEAARTRGLRVPDDLSIVGFDDTQLARMSSPPLTTVRQPLSEMGGMAVRTALRLIAGASIDSHHVELATELDRARVDRAPVGTTPQPAVRPGAGLVAEPTGQHRVRTLILRLIAAGRSRDQAADQSAVGVVGLVRSSANWATSSGSTAASTAYARSGVRSTTS